MMTNEEWAKCRKALAELHNIVELNVDGYKVQLALCRTGTYKNSILIYINHIVKGAWLAEDCEERRRFLRKSENSLYSKQQVSGFPKKVQKEFLSKKFTMYHLNWLSFGALKKHLLANNKDISLVKIGF